MPLSISHKMTQSASMQRILVLHLFQSRRVGPSASSVLLSCSRLCFCSWRWRVQDIIRSIVVLWSVPLYVSWFLLDVFYFSVLSILKTWSSAHRFNEIQLRRFEDSLGRTVCVMLPHTGGFTELGGGQPLFSMVKSPFACVLVILIYFFF